MLERHLAELEELSSVDPDVEPVDVRTLDRGLPDGFWWAATVALSYVIGVAASFPLFRLGQHVSLIAHSGVFVAGIVFASKRWGHRRYRLRAAARASLRALLAAAGLVTAVLAWDWLVALWRTR